MSDYKWKPFTLLVSEQEVERKLKLEAGKYYKTRDGRKVGPMRYDKHCAPHLAFDIRSLGMSGDAEINCSLWSTIGTHERDRNLDLVSEWPTIPESPIREVTRRDLVSGRYGRVVVGIEENGKAVVDFTSDDGELDYIGHQSRLSASELREAAHTLNQIAEFLESERK